MKIVAGIGIVSTSFTTMYYITALIEVYVTNGQEEGGLEGNNCEYELNTSLKNKNTNPVVSYSYEEEVEDEYSNSSTPLFRVKRTMQGIPGDSFEVYIRMVESDTGGDDHCFERTIPFDLQSNTVLIEENWRGDNDEGRYKVSFTVSGQV